MALSHAGRQHRTPYASFDFKMPLLALDCHPLFSVGLHWTSPHLLLIYNTRSATHRSCGTGALPTTP